jgi:hypothetical protein
MPGYLSNRVISFNPAAELAAVQESLTSLESIVITLQEDVEDIQLNIGV